MAAKKKTAPKSKPLPVGKIVLAAALIGGGVYAYRNRAALGAQLSALIAKAKLPGLSGYDATPRLVYAPPGAVVAR